MKRDKPIRNTDKQYECTKPVVEYWFDSGEGRIDSKQVATIANEIMWSAIELSEEGDELCVRLIDSPVYHYRLSDFRKL